MNDGLINGTQCIIKYIQTTKHNINNLPYIVWVYFKTLTLVQTNAKNTHTSIQHTTQTDNGHLLLKLKEHSLSKTTGFIEYNSLYNKLLHVQFMSLRAPLTSKFMLTCKQLQNHPQHSGNTCTMLLSTVTLISGLYIENINEDNISISKKVSHYLNNSPPHNNLQTQIQFHDENTCNVLLNNAHSFKKYFHTIKNNQIVLKQNITIFLESKFSQHDKSIDYQINNCIIIKQMKKIQSTHTAESYHTSTVQLKSTAFKTCQLKQSTNYT